MPTISRYMKRQPWTIHRDATLATASELMTDNQIRHLPVLFDGKLVGIVSQRDLYRLERLSHLEAHFTVGDAMSDDVYTARLEDSVDEVVEAMAEHKYGSTVVVNAQNEVVGIFTTTDGMQVLCDLLRRETA